MFRIVPVCGTQKSLKLCLCALNRRAVHRIVPAALSRGDDCEPILLLMVILSMLEVASLNTDNNLKKLNTVKNKTNTESISQIN